MGLPQILRKYLRKHACGDGETYRVCDGVIADIVTELDHLMQEVVHVALKLMCGANRRFHAKIIVRATNNMEIIKWTSLYLSPYLRKCSQMPVYVLYVGLCHLLYPTITYTPLWVPLTIGDMYTLYG